ncbi:MAG: hypothetical protein HWN65_15850 [Candidatus Helarchaeota archaeon]|nr:hypothetical protein [Candidatus Helarchaeota archaeon]
MRKNLDFIQIWAEEFKKNPQKNRKLLNQFVTAQILYAQKQLKKLPIEKLIKLFNINNEEIIEIISTRKRENEK